MGEKGDRGDKRAYTRPVYFLPVNFLKGAIFP